MVSLIPNVELYVLFQNVAKYPKLPFYKFRQLRHCLEEKGIRIGAPEYYLRKEMTESTALPSIIPTENYKSQTVMRVFNCTAYQVKKARRMHAGCGPARFRQLRHFVEEKGIRFLAPEYLLLRKEMAERYLEEVEVGLAKLRKKKNNAEEQDVAFVHVKNNE